MSKEKQIHITFKSPLNNGDTELQTYGCRHTNPDICDSNSVQGVCAFVVNDNICKKPLKAWKKQYIKLKEEQYDNK